jgi:hypothetical protein
MPISGLGPLTRLSVIRICPDVGGTRPPIMLNKVDFPQPDGPMTDMNSPGLTSSDM